MFGVSGRRARALTLVVGRHTDRINLVPNLAIRRRMKVRKRFAEGRKREVGVIEAGGGQEAQGGAGMEMAGGTFARRNNNTRAPSAARAHP